MKGKYPTLSLQERDRRWRLVREMMKDQGFDCLIVAGLKGREMYEGYLTNECIEGIVVFPVEEEPIYLTWGEHRIMRRLESTLEKAEFWVKDIRAGANGPGIVEGLQEKGLDQAKIGVVGLESKGPGEMEGIIPYKTWSYVLEKLPKATFVDVSEAFSELKLIKSEEEMALLRRSAEIGELACDTMMKITKPGVRENEIYAAIMNTIHSHGAFSPAPHLILVTGPNNITWGPPIWAYWGGNPRVVQEGDLVLAEIFPCYGGIESQQQMTVALNPVSPLTKECAEVSRLSYEAGLNALRPGATFQAVCDAMELPIAEAGLWHLTPLIHSLSPLIWVSAIYVGIEQLPGIQKFKSIKKSPPWGREMYIKPGMAFELEPNACKAKHRVNIGGTVVVTEDGVEELNKLPTQMRVID